jgi:hypothetical protein
MTDLNKLMAMAQSYGAFVARERVAPSRAEFERLAAERGVSTLEFNAWARQRSWAEVS